MKREVYSFISGLLLFSCLAISCDDGKIYDENNQTEREGGTVKLTAQINGIDSWPGGYSVVLAGFTPDNAFAQTAKGISQTADGTINMVLAGIPSEVTQIEVCVINKLRKRIASFYTADYTEQADTIRLDAGKLDASMFNSIQTEIFNRSCTACHGGSTEPAAGLYLTEGKSYKALVDVVADKSEEGLKLVKPGSAEESFLHVILHENIVKYDHTNVITTSSTLTLLDDWINNGAKEIRKHILHGLYQKDIHRQSCRSSNFFLCRERWGYRISRSARYYRPDIAVFRTTSEHPTGLCGSYPRGVT